VPDADELAPYADRVHRLGFVDWRVLVRVLGCVDVNLAPLEPDNPFNEAKSAIKWLEAALAGTPTVASPTVPFADAIEPGVTGVLASSTDEWVAAMLDLVDDPRRRERMGEQARRQALLRWSPAVQGRRYVGLLEHIAAEQTGAGAARVTGWEPVAPPEPLFPARHPLEPYEEGGGWRRRLDRLDAWRTAAGGQVAWSRVRARALAQRARQLLADEGPVGVVRGAGRRVRRRP
jgi:hypothetical protein